MLREQLHAYIPIYVDERIKHRVCCRLNNPFFKVAVSFLPVHTVFFQKTYVPGSHQVSLLQCALDPPVASQRWNLSPFAAMKLKLN